MDTLMGGLFGLPKFGFVEGTVMLIGLAGMIFCFATDDIYQCLTICGLLAYGVYFGTVVIFAIFIGDEAGVIIGCSVISVFNIAVAFWRFFGGYMDKRSDYELPIYIWFGLCALFLIVCTINFKRNYPSMEETIKYYLQMKDFWRGDKKNQIWPEGADKPLNFEYDPNDPDKYKNLGKKENLPQGAEVPA